MKSKVDLLHGMIKDLMKVPLEHGGSEHGGEPKGVHMTIIAADKPHDGMDEPDSDDMSDPMDSLEQDKHSKMEKAIHAKNKGMI